MASRLGFRHIETIRAVILTGSVTGAAARLFVTQPAVSNMLREAEDRLGFPLFERRGGRLMPTSMADLLFEEIERSFTGLSAINEYCEQLKLSRKKRICVACTPTFGATVLPAVIEQQMKKDASSPAFFSVHSRVAHHVAALVSSRKADIGFALRVPDIPSVDSAVLGELSLFCYLPANHALAAHPILNAQQLQDEPMISLSRVEGIDDLVEQAFSGVTGSRPVAVAECPAAIAACAMVAAGIGFTLFDLLPSQLFDASRVAVRAFSPDVRITYQAYWLKSRKPYFDHEPLVDLARQVLDEMVARLKRDKA